MNHQQYLNMVDDVRRHAYLYYTLDMPEISDAEYDHMFRQLLDYEESHPDDVSPITPTRGVAGGTRPMGVTFPHTRPMLSIDNVFSYQELMDWAHSIRKQLKRPVPVVAEFKFDGLAISLHYTDGVLQRALTRGDGIEGEDVTINVLQIGTVPKNLRAELTGEIRGEVVVPIDVLEELNDRLVAAGKKAYANTRNAAAGIVRRGRPEQSTPLAFIPYDLIEYDDRYGIATMDYTDRRAWITTVMLSITDEDDPTTVLSNDRDERGLYIDYDDAEDWKRIIERFDALRESYPVSTDGIVFKVQKAADCEELGIGTRVVNYMRAYKFDAMSGLTKVEDMFFQVGYTGAVTPVFKLSPIQLAGVEVTRATCHNMNQLRDWNVAVGDSVEIERSGEVIPYITGIVPLLGNDNPVIRPIDTCPACATKLSTGRNSQTLYCVNPDCTGRLRARLELAFGRSALDIKGLGESLIAELVAYYGHTLTLEQIFKMNKEDFKQATTLGPKQISNIISALEKGKYQPLWRIIRAACIVGLGRSMSKVLATNASDADVECIDGIKAMLTMGSQAYDPGKVRNAIAIMERDEESRAKLDSVMFLKPIVAIAEGPDVVPDPRLMMKKFCVTGAIPGFTRDEIVDKMTRAGGEYTSSVSKRTDYLFYGLDAGSKLIKAKELGITMVNLCDPLVMEEWADVLR